MNKRLEENMLVHIVPWLCGYPYWFDKSSLKFGNASPYLVSADLLLIIDDLDLHIVGT